MDNFTETTTDEEIREWLLIECTVEEQAREAWEQHVRSSYVPPLE
jgi:hypothetical protein